MSFSSSESPHRQNVRVISGASPPSGWDCVPPHPPVNLITLYRDTMQATGSKPATQLPCPWERQGSRKLPDRSLMPFPTSSCAKGQRSGTIIPTKEESAISHLQADSSQARNGPFATFAHLFKPEHKK